MLRSGLRAGLHFGAEALISFFLGFHNMSIMEEVREHACRECQTIFQPSCECPCDYLLDWNGDEEFFPVCSQCCICDIIPAGHLPRLE